MYSYQIFNKNALKIIEVLKEGRFYFNQIYEKTSIKSKNNLIKNLNLLLKFNILKKEENKSNTFYSINYENNISLSLLSLTDIVKFQNLPFERRKPVEEAIKSIKPIIAVLFGSTAKGNFKKDSDIDLLLVAEKPKDIEKEVKEISSRYGTRINPVVISLQEFETGNDALNHIIKTGYPIAGYNYFYEKKKV